MKQQLHRKKCLNGTAYDVAYLDLASHLSLPLATGDDDLRRAALAEGVRIL
jgi:predicted nucleic acid-binding protein